WRNSRACSRWATPTSSPEPGGRGTRRGAAATASAGEPGGDAGDVAPLVAGAGQLVLARLARAVAGEGGGAVGRAAGDLVHAHLPLEAVGQADDDQAVMQ